MPPTFDSRRLYVSSPLFSPLILASIRLLFAVYTLTVLIYVLVWYNINSSGGRFFSYFTQLTQIGLCAYFWASAVQGFGFLRHNQKWYPLQKWGRVLQALHVILHASIIVFPILVTIVYWVLLADADTFDGTYRAWSTISLHALNSIYALFEIFLTNSPPSPWWTIIPLELMLGGYLGVAYLTEATQGWYPYAFLNPSEHSAGVLAGYIVGIAVGNIVVFLIVRGAVVLRMKVAVRSGRLPVVTVDEDLAEGHQSQKPVGLV